MWAFTRTVANISLICAVATVVSPVAFAQHAPGQAEVGAPRARPQTAPLRIENLSPDLERILLAWSRSTDTIKELKGTHKRFVYDHVFETERWATGKFYYKAPDQGRIDLVPVEIKEGGVGGMKNKAGQPFKLVADQPEKWICDGTRIMQIDEQQKQISIISIPEQRQGRNIMEGPLPFLFGMPPKMAKQRYELSLERNGKQNCVIHAVPRWQADAANYSEARIMLDKRTWLPKAVKLLDPAKTKETVYVFEELDQQIDNPWKIWEKDPFEINWNAYKVVNKNVAKSEAAPQRNRNAADGTGSPTRSPNGRGANRLRRPREAAGNRDVETGTATRRPRVTPTGGESPTRPAGANHAMPSFQRMTALQAKKTADRIDVHPEYRKGNVAPSPELIFTIYAQSPPAGTPVGPTSKVILLYYDDPQAAAAPRK